MVFNPCASLTSTSCLNHSRIKGSSAQPRTNSLDLKPHFVLQFTLLLFCSYNSPPPKSQLSTQRSPHHNRALRPPGPPCCPSQGAPLGHTRCLRGYTHILPLAQDGDLALSHFHWKTTASGYHRCQQGARGVALAMMLLAAAAAEVGETCFAFIFCLALWPASGAGPSCRASVLPAKRAKTVCYVYTFRVRFTLH